MTFIRLHFDSSAECWINADQIESVITRLDQQGEPIGSRVRTLTGMLYEVAQTPDEVLELLNRALSEVRDD